MNGQYDLQLKKGENPFQKSYDFAKKRTSELRVFSVCFLVSFSVFEIGIIIGSLFWLKGYRRVLRWLLIPLSAIVYTALGLAVVHLVVDFRPETQLLQEVDSVEGWSESLVHTDVTRLGFEDGRATFNAPALAKFDEVVSDSSTPLESTQTDDKTLFSLRQRYGKYAYASVRYWIPSKNPCEITANREIVATRPLHGAWLWDGKVWRNLGPMEPGKPIAIDQAHVVIDPSQISGKGNPGDTQHPWQSQELLPEMVKRMCNTAYMSSLKGTNVGLLLAIDDQAAPDRMEDAATSEVHTQTILVHQFQFPPVQP